MYTEIDPVLAWRLRYPGYARPARRGGEMAYAGDLKSPVSQEAYGFDPRPRHLQDKGLALFDSLSGHSSAGAFFLGSVDPTARGATAFVPARAAHLRERFLPA